jgi:hypothetical protein
MAKRNALLIDFAVRSVSIFVYTWTDCINEQHSTAEESDTGRNTHALTGTAAKGDARKGLSKFC